VSQYQKGKTNLDFTEARDSEWQWHQLGHMQVCISFQTDNHASTPPLSFLQAGCPSCCPTNSVKVLKAVNDNGVYKSTLTHMLTRATLDSALLLVAGMYPCTTLDQINFGSTFCRIIVTFTKFFHHF